MPVVKCHLENASEKINGVPFKKSDCGTHMVTPDLPHDIASRFDGIPGYEIVDLDAPLTPPETPPLAAPGHSLAPSPGPRAPKPRPAPKFKPSASPGRRAKPAAPPAP